MQKIGKSAKSSMVTQRATLAVNQALVERQKKTDKKTKVPQDTVDYKLGRWMSAEEANRRKKIEGDTSLSKGSFAILLEYI
jgi:hypothetical protein